MTISFRKAKAIQELVKGLLTSESFTFDERTSLKSAKRLLEDAVLGLSTKFQCNQENYTEMKGHKANIENESGLKRLLSDYQLERENILSANIEIEIEPFAISWDFSRDGESAKDYKLVALELEDILFLPKK